MTALFGEAWRQSFNQTHRLVVHDDLAYCRICGKYTTGSRGVTGLAKRCEGEPQKNTPRMDRLNRLREGKHPVTNEKLPKWPLSLQAGVPS